jgi:hypothetical protein
MYFYSRNLGAARLQIDLIFSGAKNVCIRNVAGENLKSDMRKNNEKISG